MAALILAIFFVGVQMRRYVVKPLESMSGTARQIAEGDLDLNLPVSRVTEIAEVRTGFEVMVTGLRESFQKQSKLEEERRFFIGAIAHYLRTPLFVLRGYLKTHFKAHGGGLFAANDPDGGAVLTGWIPG